MPAIALCAVLVALGVAAVVRPAGPPRRTGWLWHAGGALAAGLVAGILAAGAGGRLVLRLLAITSPEAEFSLTEAGEVVGEITLDGTLAFILFAGVPAGFLAGVLYAVLAPLLLRGRAGGLVLGALLLVVAGTRIEPLRADNVDFAIVGPPWLAVLSFTAVALFQGLLTVALARRIATPPELPVRALAAGRIAVAVLVVVALPGFVGALAEIA